MNHLLSVPITRQREKYCNYLPSGHHVWLCTNVYTKPLIISSSSTVCLPSPGFAEKTIGFSFNFYVKKPSKHVYETSSSRLISVFHQLVVRQNKTFSRCLINSIRVRIALPYDMWIPSWSLKAGNSPQGLAQSSPDGSLHKRRISRYSAVFWSAQQSKRKTFSEFKLIYYPVCCMENLFK